MPSTNRSALSPAARREHLDRLREFLTLRGFYRTDVTIDEIPEGAG